MFACIGFLVKSSERNSEFEMHEQTDIVDL